MCTLDAHIAVVTGEAIDAFCINHNIEVDDGNTFINGGLDRHFHTFPLWEGHDCLRTPGEQVIQLGCHFFGIAAGVQLILDFI